MDNHISVFIVFAVICFIVIMLGFIGHLVRQNKKNNAIIKAVEKERLAIKKAIDEENKRLEKEWETFYKNKY